MLTHHFHPTSLREYDIRGLVDDTLTDADAYAIGRSFGTVIARAGGSRVAVGYDGRLSSPRFEGASRARAERGRGGGGAHRRGTDADALLCRPCA